MKIGRRLAIKLLNASKFVLSLPGAPATGAVESPRRSTWPCWPGWPTLVDEATAAFEGYDYARALERTEAFFWAFCDDYLELVKSRAYGGRATAAASANADPARWPCPPSCGCSPRSCPSSPRRSWSWWQEGSVHRAPWPRVTELGGSRRAPTRCAGGGGRVLGEVRKAKTAAGASMRAPARLVVVRDKAARLAALDQAGADVQEAGTIAEMVTEEADDFSVKVELAPAILTASPLAPWRPRRCHCCSCCLSSLQAKGAGE